MKYSKVKVRDRKGVFTFKTGFKIYLEAIRWLPSRVMTCFSELWVRNFLSGTGSSTRHLFSNFSKLPSPSSFLTELTKL